MLDWLTDPVGHIALAQKEILVVNGQHCCGKTSFFSPGVKVKHPNIPPCGPGHRHRGIKREKAIVQWKKQQIFVPTEILNWKYYSAQMLRS